jgi:hypothetical protein
MLIDATQHAKLPHITVITLPYKNQKRIASKVLPGQCCTKEGLISTQDLDSMLGLPMANGNPYIFCYSSWNL